MITRSESFAKLAVKLAEVQAACHNATKNQKNDHHKNKYADLGACIEVIKEPLATHGVLFLQLPTVSENTEVLILTTLLAFEDEWIQYVSGFPIAAIGNRGINAQTVGSTITYARRYTIKSIFNFAEDDDDGNAASGLIDSQSQERRRIDANRERARQRVILWIRDKGKLDPAKVDFDALMSKLDFSKPMTWKGILMAQHPELFPTAAETSRAAEPNEPPR